MAVLLSQVMGLLEPWQMHQMEDMQEVQKGLLAGWLRWVTTR